MAHQIQEVVARGKAAAAYIKELLVNSSFSERGELIEQFIRYIFPPRIEKSPRALDLNGLFYFVLAGSDILVIPKARYAAKEVLLLKEKKGEEGLIPETVEFSEENPMDRKLRIDSHVSLTSYLRKCLRQGAHREFLEG